MDKTFDSLRRLRDTRHRKAAIDKMRQDHVASATARSVAAARERLTQEIAARGTLATRLHTETDGNDISPRALQDTVHADMFHVHAAHLAHQDALRADEKHALEERHLAELRHKLNRAHANVKKIGMAISDASRATSRRDEAREEDEADDAALRTYASAATRVLTDADDDSRDDGRGVGISATDAMSALSDLRSFV